MMKWRMVVYLFLITAVVSCKTNRRNAAKFTYIFNSYKEIGTKSYLDVKVLGEGRNENLLILVEDWHKLEGLRSTKGLGYRGCELKGFEIKIVDDPVTKYSYKNLESIVD